MFSAAVTGSGGKRSFNRSLMAVTKLGLGVLGFDSEELPPVD